MASVGISNSNNRNEAIDILRFVALLGIIIIHCDPQCFFVRQLRNFDVPLMVFLAGVSYGISARKHKETYGQYLWKRFKRMIIPTWIFLLMLTGLTLISTHSLPEQEWLISTFSLTTREWYVWIIRVLFIMAVVAPLTIPYIEKRFSVIGFCVICCVLLVALELIPHKPESLILYLILEFIPFFIVFTYGCEIKQFSKRNILLIALVSFVVYLIYAIVLYVQESQPVNTQIEKYPPHLYYISYSIACLSVLWVYKEKLVFLFDKLRLTQMFCFIGSHTLWIYFWHIAILHIMFYLTNSFWLRFAVVGVGSCVVTYIQYRLLQAIIARVDNKRVKTNLNLIFNG